jgi:Arc/MetJ-type ribon-helix-helix transcriptional regulator
LPTGNYKSVTLKEELVDRVKRLISKVKTYHSVAEFISEAVRLRVEAIERQEKAARGGDDERER